MWNQILIDWEDENEASNINTSEVAKEKPLLHTVLSYNHGLGYIQHRQLKLCWAK